MACEWRAEPVGISQAKQVGHKTCSEKREQRPRGESIANLGSWEWLLMVRAQSLMEWETEGRSWAIDALQQQLKG